MVYIPRQPNITILGSCRNSIPSSNRLNSDINCPHCTKEIIQFIKFISGNLDLTNPLSDIFSLSRILFHAESNEYCDPVGISYNTVFTEIFNRSPLCVVEISSRKKFIYDNRFYMHHLAVDKRYTTKYPHTPKEVLNNYKIEDQDYNEIEKDILLIREMLSPKKC